MNKLFLALPLAFAIAACGEEPATEPAEVATVAPEPITSLPAPDQALFSEKFAEACPDAEPVSTAVCRRAGLGSPDVVCEYGLGEDEYRRNRATLTAGENDWALADPDNVCAA